MVSPGFLGLSWAQHRLRVLIRLPHVKNCQFFLYEDEFIFALVFELCRGKEIRERKTRLSRFEFAFVRETEILFVLCMCAVGGVALHKTCARDRDQ